MVEVLQTLESQPYEPVFCVHVLVAMWSAHTCILATSLPVVICSLYLDVATKH